MSPQLEPRSNQPTKRQMRARRVMRAIAALILGCATVVAATGATSTQAPAQTATLTAMMSSASSMSPAARRVAAARTAIAKNPKRAEVWNELALALSRRARETGDPEFYKQAWEATEESLRLEVGNLEARKLQVWILLGQHQFARAVEAAEQITRAMPDDVLVYGFLVDGYVELGRYEQAEKAAQWMLDLRPGNVPGLTRAAHLRELFGDHDGAVQFMDMAYRRTADTEVEDRAWILTQIAHLSLLTCRTGAAEQLLNEALSLFPDYHYAIAEMAELRVQQGRADDAVALRRRHYSAAPHPENQYELGVALARAGQLFEAQAVWQQFEAAALREMEGWDNANIELIYYYADHANRPAEALAIARREATRRQDVRTLEALAWALHKNGQSRDAWREIGKALAVGLKDPVSFYHAGVIAAAAVGSDDAERYLEQSIATCGNSRVARSAREQLRAIVRD